MKFKPEKDLIFGVIILGAAITMTIVAAIPVIKFVSMEKISIPALLLMILLYWIWFGTYYEVKDSKFIWRFGPFKQTINITQIHTAVKNKTLWKGFKPALARNGVIVRYNTNDEVYVSPRDKETFVNELIKHNPSIKIIS